MAVGEQERARLGAFLRARRAEVTPESVGLPRVGHPRRVTGLRRSEVAQIASISIEYYTRLEQGKLPPPSPAVLSAISRALRLDPDQELYLRRLSDRGEPRPPDVPQERAPGQILALLDALSSIPALVLTRALDVLAWNPLAAVLFTDFAALPVGERNALRLVFLHDEMRSRFADGSSAALTAASILRMTTARDPADPRVAALVDELSQLDGEFRKAWASQTVASSSHGRRAYVHPMVGELELEWQTLTSSANPDLFIIVLTPVDAAGAAALRKLRDAGSP